MTEKEATMTDAGALQQLHAVLEPLFPGLMGVRLVELAPERIEAEMPVRADLCTVGGTLHGGALMAFADTLGAVGTHVNMPAGSRTTTVSSSTQFIAAAKAGSTVRGVASALHRGRTTMVWQTEIFAADGRLCGVVTQTQIVIPPEAPSALPPGGAASGPAKPDPRRPSV